MARLTTPPPRLSLLTPRAIGAPMATPEQARRAAAPWKAWYGTERWRRLRREVLIRDLFTCQRTGALLTGRHPAPNSPVVNHKRAHRGDEALFWDIDNLETVSKEIHDGLIQREEQATRGQGGIWT